MSSHSAPSLTSYLASPWPGWTTRMLLFRRDGRLAAALFSSFSLRIYTFVFSEVVLYSVGCKHEKLLFLFNHHFKQCSIDSLFCPLMSGTAVHSLSVIKIQNNPIQNLRVMPPIASSGWIHGSRDLHLQQGGQWSALSLPLPSLKPPWGCALGGKWKVGGGDGVMQLMLSWLFCVLLVRHQSQAALARSPRCVIPSSGGRGSSTSRPSMKCEEEFSCWLDLQPSSKPSKSHPKDSHQHPNQRAQVQVYSWNLTIIGVIFLFEQHLKKEFSLLKNRSQRYARGAQRAMHLMALFSYLAKISQLGGLRKGVTWHRVVLPLCWGENCPFFLFKALRQGKPRTGFLIMSILGVRSICSDSWIFFTSILSSPKSQSCLFLKWKQSSSVFFFSPHLANC